MLCLQRQPRSRSSVNLSLALLSYEASWSPFLHAWAVNLLLQTAQSALCPSRCCPAKQPVVATAAEIWCAMIYMCPCAACSIC